MNRITLPDGDPRDFIDYREGSGGTIEIFDIVVMSERRTGIGRKLMELLFARDDVKDAPTVYAITRATNLIAQQFYEGLVFDRVGVLRRFYKQDGRVVDAIIYGRSPKGPV